MKRDLISSRFQQYLELAALWAKHSKTIEKHELCLLFHKNVFCPTLNVEVEC